MPSAAVGYLGVNSRAPPEDPDAATGGVFWAGSLAAFFPVSPRIRLGPGVTLLKPPADDLDWQLRGGLTVALGDSPD